MFDVFYVYMPARVHLGIRGHVPSHLQFDSSTERPLISRLSVHEAKPRSNRL